MTPAKPIGRGTRFEREVAARRAKDKLGEDAYNALAEALGIAEDEFKRDEEVRALRLMVGGRYVHVRDDVVAMIVARLNQSPTPEKP